jgi:hypothetical protein
MRRRSLILGLLAVAAMGGARAAERKSSHRIAIVVSAGSVTTITESGDAFFLAIVSTNSVAWDMSRGRIS